MVSLAFILVFMLFYALLGTWLILRGFGLWKESPPSVAGLMPYPKIGDPAVSLSPRS